METPFFSIITVSFNSEKTIERTIKSVLCQSFQDFEYIIVDGASRDSTMKIVRHYEDAFEGRMHYVSEPDKGIYDAMNKGIGIATGKIVGIVNSDDWLELDALENIHQAAVSQEEVCVYTGDIRYFYNNGTTQIISYNAKKLKRYSKVFLIGVNHPATFVPHILYDKFGLFDTNLRIQADGDLINRIYHNNVSFVFLSRILSNQSDGGASQTNYKQTLKDYKYILNKNEVNTLFRNYLYLKFCFRLLLRKYSPTWLKKIRRKYQK